MRFDIVLSPRFALDPAFGALASGEDPFEVAKPLQLDVSAPTDDRPFFFSMKPFRYLFRTTKLDKSEYAGLQSGEFVLILLLGVTCLSLYFILVPLARTVSKETLRGSAPHWLFFTAIGLGFMLIEVSQMQRLIVFLGHPTYALSVVLFTLLLSGGLGSATTASAVTPGKSAASRVLLLWISLLVFGFVTPQLTTVFGSATTPVRIMLAIGILFPVGFLMGMAFPLGLIMSARYFDTLMPAFWGVNGAASICASILAMAIAMNVGISTAFWTGFWCYGIALLACYWIAIGYRPDGPPEHA